MRVFLKLLLILLVFLASTEQTIASIKNASSLYQWFTVVDTSNNPVPYYFYAVNFVVYTSIDCDENSTCMSYLVGSAGENTQEGKIIFNDLFCSFQESINIPLAVTNRNVTTNAPVTYSLGECSVSITGDPNSEEGYKITVTHLK